MSVKLWLSVLWHHVDLAVGKNVWKCIVSEQHDILTHITVLLMTDICMAQIYFYRDFDTAVNFKISAMYSIFPSRALCEI